MGSFSMVLDTAFRCCARYSLSTRGELDKDGHRDELLFSGALWPSVLCLTSLQEV